MFAKLITLSVSNPIKMAANLNLSKLMNNKIEIAF